MAGSTPRGAGRRRASGNAPTPTRTPTRTSTRAAAPAAAPTGRPTATGRPTSTARPAKRRFWNYPRRELRGLHRWLPSWRVVVGGILAGGFLVLGLLVAAYQLTPIPEPDEFTSAQTTTVYYSDGTTPMGTFATQKRELVEYGTLPDYVGNAVVAAEDRTFYDNQGISVTGMGRAFINNIKGNRIQGGSTITQQYAERYYAGKTTTSYVGKFKETILAIKIGRSQDKPDVLGKYLNTIYWGRDSYGIQTAAQAYFGVNAKDLTISQAAMLAGIIPSPNNWDPRVSPEKAEQRWNYVLDGMVEGKFITQAERDAQVLPETIEFTKSDVYAGPQGYLLDMVRRELTTRTSTITDETLDTIGLKVVTTIEKPAQDLAVASVAGLRDGTLAGEAPNPAMKVGVVSIDPADGAIVSLYGGPDFITQSRNAATQDAAQAGSTFKPFTLIAALEQGIGLDTRFNGRSPQTFDGWGKVQNFDNDSEGRIDLVRATAMSVNTVYAQLNLQVGADKTADVAQRAGIRTTLDSIHPANVLGTDTVHPLDMASAYATIAAQGWYSTPFIVREATYLTDGAVAYQGAQDRVQVFQPDVTADATYAMTQVVEKGSGKKWVKPLGRPIAGKTGTSTDNKSAWFVGFTPQIATAVAFYQPTADGKGQDKIQKFGGVRQITGGTWPSALWASYMKQVFTLEKYAAIVPFPERANVGKQTPTAAPTVSAAPTTEAPPPPSTATVPSGLEGKLRADAEAAVTNAGLVAEVTEQASDTVPAGRVISISPGGGTTVNPGAAVSIVVSTGPAEPDPEVTPDPGATPTP